FVGDHFAAGGEAYECAEISPRVFFEFGAVAAFSKIVGDGVAAAGHVARAAHLDVVAAGEIELTRVLLPVEPPRGVEVSAARAVFGVGREIFQNRDVAEEARADGGQDVLADVAAGIGGVGVEEGG